MNEKTIQTNLTAATVEENLVLAVDEPAAYAITATTGTTVTMSGVYKLQNTGSYKYATVRMGYVTSGTLIMQYGGCYYQLPMQWKIKHVGNGKHTIRPMHKLNLAMTATSSSAVCVKDIGDVDSSCIASQSLWTIEKYGTGYFFKNVHYPKKVLATIAGNTDDYSNLQLIDYSTAANATNQRWYLSRLATTQDQVLLYKSEWETYDTDPAIVTMDVKGAKQLSVAFYSFNDISQDFTWTSSDTSVVRVSQLGKVTALGRGIAHITVVHKQSKISKTYTISVDVPTQLFMLYKLGCISENSLRFTDDQFTLCVTSLADILKSRSITNLYNEDHTAHRVDLYYDDWYVCAVEGSNRTIYSLIKMREPETDNGDGNSPGVTVCFVEFDIAALVSCLGSNSMTENVKLYQEVSNVVESLESQHSSALETYYKAAAAKGAYLIAEMYVQYIASLANGGVINAPENYIELINEIERYDEYILAASSDNNAVIELSNQKNYLNRVPKALSEINKKAGRTIFSNNKIYLSNDAKNLSIYEKQAILALFTGDVTFNSFAAEIVYHAANLTNELFIKLDYYPDLIRADIILETSYSFYKTLVDDYLDLESELVQDQVNAHGEY